MNQSLQQALNKALGVAGLVIGLGLSAQAGDGPTPALVSFPSSSPSPSPSPALASASPVSCDRGVSLVILALTNAERGRHALPPLALSEELCAAAAGHAKDMADLNYFNHEDRAGGDPASRAIQAGYRRFAWIGENIAAGQPSAEEAMVEWIRSPEHLENIISKDARELGVGFASNSSAQFQSYWVQELGSRFNYFPVVINLGQAETQSPAVNLYIYGEGWAKDMRLSNDEVTWSEWSAFRPDLSWQLSDSQGLKKVSVQIRKDSIVRSASASIQYNLPPPNPEPTR